jgi:hypothetical protein
MIKGFRNITAVAIMAARYHAPAPVVMGAGIIMFWVLAALGVNA